MALDHLSGGRMTLGVGLGFSGEAEFEQFGEDGDARVRAGKLDECLTIVRGLCTGEPFACTGEHYTVRETTFQPRPVQDQIPVWVAGYWPNKRPFRRAARWDGPATPGEREELISAYGSAGVTWILRDMLPWETPLEEATRIVRAGPSGRA